MSWKIVAIVLLIMIMMAPVIIYPSNNNSSKIIIYGTHKCPACSGLKEFFDSTGLPYEFREIYDCQLSGCKLTNYGLDLARIINIAGLEAYIPVSAVVDDNGYVIAIVQGRVENKAFWNKLLSQKFKCGIEVYSDGKVGEITDPGNISEVIKIVTGKDISKTKIESMIKSCSITSTTTTVKPSTPPGEENRDNWQFIILGITLAIIFGSIILYMVLRSRSKYR